MGTENITHGLRIGSDKNHMLIDEFGQVAYRGKASTWEDIQTSVTGVQLDVAAGTADRNFDNNSITLQPGGVITDDGDCLSWSIQYPHKAVTNGELRVHMHWEQTALFAGEMTLQYRVQQNGGAKATSWTTVVVPFGNTGQDTFAYVSGTLNQITPLAAIQVAGLSTIVQFRLCRTDAIAGSIEVLFLDAHYEIDGTGSSEEYVK